MGGGCIIPPTARSIQAPKGCRRKPRQKRKTALKKGLYLCTASSFGLEIMVKSAPLSLSVVARQRERAGPEQ